MPTATSTPSSFPLMDTLTGTIQPANENEADMPLLTEILATLRDLLSSPELVLDMPVGR